MHRLHVWRDFLLVVDGVGLLAVGLEMLDGSYYRETIYGDNFPPPGDPSVGFGGGD